ncbi:MAG: GNAT family protein [Cyanobacteria bacterium J06650_10]
MFSDQIAFEPSSPEMGLSKTDSSAFACQISDHHQLRLLTAGDAEALFALVNANRTYLKRWLSWLDTTQTLDDTRHFIRQTWHRAADNQGFAAAIIYDQMLVGVAGLNGISWRDRKSSIGYWLAAPYQGKGLITLSCQAIIDYSFNVMALNRIAILCASQNHRSKAVPKRLGFIHEGTLRDAQWLYDHFVDHEVYSMLRHDWLLT